ncbi:MAG: hypothetical protein IJ879_02315 [Muribaculaceae bacterium]|nr:hypothetical protein [Muribaculaceae bacterium]
MMTKEKRILLSNVLVMLGLLVMVVMAVMELFYNVATNEWILWGYTAGALTVLVARFIGYDGSGSLRVKRLHHLLIFSALLYCASASIKFIPELYKNWVALLLAGLVVQMYASWMIDKENRKSEK